MTNPNQPPLPLPEFQNNQPDAGHSRELPEKPDDAVTIAGSSEQLSLESEGVNPMEAIRRVLKEHKPEWYDPDDPIFATRSSAKDEERRKRSEIKHLSRSLEKDSHFNKRFKNGKKKF